MNRVLWIIMLNAALLATFLVTSLFVDAFVTPSTGTGLTIPLVLKGVFFILCFHIVVELQHRFRKRLDRR